MAVLKPIADGLRTPDTVQFAPALGAASLPDLIGLTGPRSRG